MDRRTFLSLAGRSSQFLAMGITYEIKGPFVTTVQPGGHGYGTQDDRHKF